MTAQVSEKLSYKGEKLSLCSNPLSVFLANTDIEFQCTSTACWRGYVGSWSIENDRLYLKKIKGHFKNGKELSLTDLFPGFSSGVFAHWYTGELRCPRGGLLNYVHGGYASTYEEDLYITIKKGLVISERVVINGISEQKSKNGYGVGAYTTWGVKNESE